MNQTHWDHGGYDRPEHTSVPQRPISAKRSVGRGRRGSPPVVDNRIQQPSQNSPVASNQPENADTGSTSSREQRRNARLRGSAGRAKRPDMQVYVPRGRRSGGTMYADQEPPVGKSAQNVDYNETHDYNDEERQSVERHTFSDDNSPYRKHGSGGESHSGKIVSRHVPDGVREERDERLPPKEVDPKKSHKRRRKRESSKSDKAEPLDQEHTCTNVESKENPAKSLVVEHIKNVNKPHSESKDGGMCDSETHVLKQDVNKTADAYYEDYDTREDDTYNDDDAACPGSLQASSLVIHSQEDLSTVGLEEPSANAFAVSASTTHSDEITNAQSRIDNMSSNIGCKNVITPDLDTLDNPKLVEPSGDASVVAIPCKLDVNTNSMAEESAGPDGGGVITGRMMFSRSIDCADNPSIHGLSLSVANQGDGSAGCDETKQSSTCMDTSQDKELNVVQSPMEMCHSPPVTTVETSQGTKNVPPISDPSGDVLLESYVQDKITEFISQDKPDVDPKFELSPPQNIDTLAVGALTKTQVEESSNAAGDVWQFAQNEVPVDEEDSWDTLFDDEGEALDPTLMDELTAAVGNVTVKKTQFDYYNFQPKEPDMNYEEYNHLIEIYDFPTEFITRDLIMSFSEFMKKGFDIKWVDDTHAIGVFASSIAAASAIQTKHPLLKVRPISEATPATKMKAKKSTEFLQPYKPRPETNASVARNLVAGALGLKSRVCREKQNEDRKLLRAARDKKKMASRQKKDAWEGVIGKCAMDEER